MCFCSSTAQFDLNYSPHRGSEWQLWRTNYYIYDYLRVVSCKTAPLEEALISCCQSDKSANNGAKRFCDTNCNSEIIFQKTEPCWYSEIDVCFPPGSIHSGWMAWMIFTITTRARSIITPPALLIICAAVEIIFHSWLSGKLPSTARGRRRLITACEVIMNNYV